MNMTVARITMRSLLGRKRALLLLPLPLLLIGLTVFAHILRPDAERWARPLIVGLGFGVVVPVLSLIIGTAVVGAEIDDGTIVHILTKPLSRTSILLAKLLVAIVVTALVNGAMMLICGIVASTARVGMGLAIGAVIASICYCALFVMLSLLSRRPVLIGLVYILIWEGLLGNLLTGTKSLSIEQYALTFATKISSSSLLTSSVSLTTSIAMSVVFVVAGALLAIDRLRSFTLAGETS